MNSDKKGFQRPLRICIFTAICALAASLAIALGAILFSCLFLSLAAALFAVLIGMRAKPVYFAVCPLSFAAGCAVIAAFGGGIALDILLLSFVAAGGVLAACVMKKSSRTSTVVAVAACFIAAILLSLLYIYISGGNTFTPSAIKEYIHVKLDAVSAFYENFFRTYLLEPLRETDYYSSLISSGKLDESDIISLIGTGVYAIAQLSIGVVIAAVQILGYVCTCWFKLFMTKLGCELVLPSPRWEVYPTKITAIVYIVAYLFNTLALFFPSGTGIMALVGIAARNIVIGITPVMVYLGVSFIFGKRRPKRARPRGGAIVLFVVILLLSPSFAISLIGFIGAFGLINLRRLEAADKEDEDNQSKNF